MHREALARFSHAPFGIQELVTWFLYGLTEVVKGPSIHSDNFDLVSYPFRGQVDSSAVSAPFHLFFNDLFTKDFELYATLGDFNSQIFSLFSLVQF